MTSSSVVVGKKREEGKTESKDDAGREQNSRDSRETPRREPRHDHVYSLSSLGVSFQHLRTRPFRSAGIATHSTGMYSSLRTLQSYCLLVYDTSLGDGNLVNLGNTLDECLDIMLFLGSYRHR